MLLGTVPQDDEREIKGCKLPTKRQVLLSLLANLRDMHWDQALSATIDSVLQHYQRSNVPTIAGRNNIGRVIKTYYDLEYMMLWKKNQDRRLADNSGVIKFKSELDNTMKFYKKTVLKDMAAAKKGKSRAEQDAIDQDILFMKSMLSDRTATYSGVHRILTESVQRRQERQTREKMLHDGEQCEYAENVRGDDDNDSPISADEDDNADEVCTGEPKRKHRRMVKEGVSIFVSHDILKSEELVSCSVRNNISPTQLTAIVYSLVSACGGDTSKLNLNARTTHRYRASIMSEISLKIKDDWHPPDKVLVHWDGKLMDTLDSKGTDDRLPILVSGLNGTKLLGVPPLPHLNLTPGTTQGDLISTATKQLLVDWKCEQNVVGMVFDTTPSNTGKTS